MVTPRVLGHAWRDLLFLHWELPPEAVRPAVPPPFELDLRDGRAWVGIVAFEVRGLRPRFAPFALDFLETNLRTYVQYRGQTGIRFLTLDAASRRAVVGGRAAYGVPYRFAKMRHIRDGASCEYGHIRTGDGASFHARCRIGPAVGTAAPGSLEHFLVERYRFHVVRRRRVVTTGVRHAPYSLHHVTVQEVAESLFAPAGLPAAVGPPHAVYSPGVEVELLR